MSKKILVTGGSGFIGHHTIEGILKKTSWDVVALDGLNYAGDALRILDIEMFAKWKKQGRIELLYHDIRSPLIGNQIVQRIGDVHYIIHMAAETHVDRSITNAEPFVMTNILGTFNVLEYARDLQKRGVLEKYIQISTDEVYGPAPDGISFHEWDPHKPSNPYAATKAAADCLAYSYHRTHYLPVIITRTINNFGERQHTEKFVMKVMRELMNGDLVEIHGSKNQIGSRCWLHARNHADALIFLLENGNPGDIYNISGEEKTNLEIAEIISQTLGIPLRYKLVDFHSCRSGHDPRYALDGSKLREMGWTPPIEITQTLKKTVEWMKDRAKDWLFIDNV